MHMLSQRPVSQMAKDMVDPAPMQHDDQGLRPKQRTCGSPRHYLRLRYISALVRRTHLEHYPTTRVEHNDATAAGCRSAEVQR